jgi:hypothetical protein
MNWKRGLLRLWGVITLGWICLAFALTLPVQSIKEEAEAKVRFNYHGTELEFPRNTKNEVIKGAITKYVQGERDKRTAAVGKSLVGAQDQAIQTASYRMYRDKTVADLANDLLAADKAGDVEAAHLIADIIVAKRHDVALPDLPPDEMKDMVTPDDVADIMVRSNQPTSYFGALSGFFELALGPPVSVLFLGCLLWWIGRGFKAMPE